MAIHDWSDLLQPRLKGRLAFLDSPRELVGVALKTLGLPYNCTHAHLQRSDVSLQQLKQRLKQLHDQVRHDLGICQEIHGSDGVTVGKGTVAVACQTVDDNAA